LSVSYAQKTRKIQIIDIMLNRILRNVLIVNELPVSKILYWQSISYAGGKPSVL